MYDSIERGAADECKPLTGRRPRTFTLTQLLVACGAVCVCAIGATTVVKTHLVNFDDDSALANFDDDHPGEAQLGLGLWRFKPPSKRFKPPPFLPENEKLKAENEKLKAENNELKKHCFRTTESQGEREEEEAVDPEGEDVEEEAVDEEEEAVDPEGEDVEEEAVDEEEEAVDEEEEAVDPEGEDAEEEAFVQTNNTAVRNYRCSSTCNRRACYCQGLGRDSHQGASIDECKETCASHSGCVGFNYWRSSHVNPGRWKCEFLTCYMNTTLVQHRGCWTEHAVLDAPTKDLYLRSHYAYLSERNRSED
jgi:hypothetical protein